MRGRFGELGKLSSRDTGENLAPAPSLANTGEQGREAESRRTSVPLVLASACGTGAWPPRWPLNIGNWVLGPRPIGEAVREPGPGLGGYSLMPSGYSWKSGQMTRLSWDLETRPPGLRDLDLCLARVRDLVQFAGPEAEARAWCPGLGSDFVWLTGTGAMARSLWRTGLYIVTMRR